MELGVALHDKGAPLEVEGMAYGEGGIRRSIWGVFWVSRTYIRKRSSQHSFVPSSVPFTIDGCTFSHAPIFVSRRKRCASWTGFPARVSARAYSARRTLRF